MLDLGDFFGRLLNLSYPLSIAKVQEIVIEGKIEKIEIHLEFSSDYRPQKEGYEYVRVHDWEERQWLHLHIFQYPCYLHCRVPKYKFRNPKSKKEIVETYQVPFARSGSGFTLLFEQVVLADLQRSGLGASTAAHFGISANRLWRLFHHYQPEEGYLIANEQVDLSEVKQLGYDESSCKKGQSYNTYFYDMERKQLLGIAEGRSSETVGEFVARASQKGFDATKIEEVSIDMSPAFTASVAQYFPQARITYDKFHVSQLVNRSFNKVRMAIARSNHTRFNKWIFFKKQLNAQEEAQLSALLLEYPELAQAYQHKEDFFALWNLKEPAYLQFWIDRCRELGRKAFTTLANTLEEHFGGIIAVFQTELNNGLLEGLNEKIQLLKRKARGYKHNTTFMKMIWFHCHNTNFSTQKE